MPHHLPVPRDDDERELYDEPSLPRLRWVPTWRLVIGAAVTFLLAASLGLLPRVVGLSASQHESAFLFGGFLFSVGSALLSARLLVTLLTVRERLGG